jgi:cardiolipin synthase A/B
VPEKSPPKEKGRKSLSKNALLSCVMGAFFLPFILFFSLTYHVLHPPLPSPESPLLFYSSHLGDDLKRVFQTAIHKAKSSLFLQIYGCTDADLIEQIQDASQKGLITSLFYDPSGSGPLKQKILSAVPISCPGLMHKKILILDDHSVFIGTANFTPTSLNMHDNVVLGFYNSELAHFIQHSLDQSFSFDVGEQKVKIWHLPDFHSDCLQAIIHAIDSSQHSLRIALFTFTHPEIIEALIRAKKRGIDVQVALDYYTSRGASKNTAKKLVSENICLHISKGGKLLHHKWCIVDSTILFVGSANWTKSAFTKNEDCVLELSPLNTKQKKHFEKIWSDLTRSL